MKRILIRKILKDAPIGDEVTVAGWVRTRRDSKGGFSFLVINDGSCFDSVQIVADGDLPNYSAEITRLFPGSSVAVTGVVVESHGKGQSVEIQASHVKVLGFSDPDNYPIGKQRVTFEKLRDLAHLRPRTNTFGAVARVRNALAFATHRFFQEKDFLYVHTPIITCSDCEGAGEMFRVTTMDPANVPMSEETGGVDWKQDFFGKPAGLTVSGQLEGETYACSLGNIYTFGPTFRADNSHTTRHLSEFWMIEPEMAFADLDDDAALAEEYMRYLFNHVLENCSSDLEFFEKRIDDKVISTLKTLAGASFEKITYTHAIELLEGSGAKFDFPVSWGIDLQSEHERYLTEQVFKGPVTVVDYPKTIKPFYMKQNDDEKTVAAMDVLLPRVGEIIGGSQREDDIGLLETAMRESGVEPEDYWWYCDLRRYGSVPHAGFGLGFERIVQFCTGMANIRDVIPFPRTPNNAEF